MANVPLRTASDLARHLGISRSGRARASNYGIKAETKIAKHTSSTHAVNE